MISSFRLPIIEGVLMKVGGQQVIEIGLWVRNQPGMFAGYREWIVHGERFVPNAVFRE